MGNKTRVIIDSESGKVVPSIIPDADGEEPVFLSSLNDEMEASLPVMTGLLVVDLKSEKRGIIVDIEISRDDPRELNWTVIFEDGFIGKFSFMKRILHLKVIGYFPPAIDYKADDTNQILKDYQEDFFQFS